VVVGGLSVSTLFTLFVVPTLFSLLLDARTHLRLRGERITEPEPQEIIID
jgi:predicted Na+-dependent transporter